MNSTQQTLAELTRVKALFQARAIAMHLGLPPSIVQYRDRQRPDSADDRGGRCCPRSAAPNSSDEAAPC